jgi:chromosome segregation protein
VESAAGGAAGGVVVDGRAAARAALEALRRGGGAGLVLAAVDGTVAAPDAPGGTTPVRSLVRARRGAPGHVERVLDALFARAFVAPDWESGIDVAVTHPELVIVTPDGDRFAASGWRVTSGRAVVTRASVEEAAAAAAAAAAPLVERRDALGAAEESVRAAREDLAASIARVAQAEAALERLEADVARTSADLATQVELGGTLEREVAELSASHEALDRELDEVRGETARLVALVEQSAEQRVRRDESLAALAARRAEVDAMAEALAREEARVAEHRRLLETRRVEIEARLEGHVGERARAAARRESLEYDLGVLDRLAGVVEEATRAVRATQEAMSDVYREQLEASRAGAQHLEQTRVARARVEAQVAALGEEQRRAEVELAELAVTLANVHEAIRRDLGVDPEAMGPAPEIDELAGTTIEELVGQLEARVTSLGPINPLALEELSELEERYRDLDAQVADVRAARRELLEVVRTLDGEIMASFTAAFADVNDHFSTLIAMLFPGGQGRLQLSEPDDPLTTGVEIEVRPMGRNVRRLSLLSGGERSMAALAFLFAVFRSRPSPFYLMDEVEAALDDVNLQRFLSLVNEFRDEAQLLVVTHQKRTMEAADALYGVTMVPGASSKVVSQRVRRTEEAVS